jgi:hypothetical protein
MTLASRVAVIATIVTAAFVATAPPARAQSAEAEALFRDGRAQIKAGQLAAGCDKLAASERLESSVGTLLNLGDCREKLGKLASAWAAFRKAAAMARRSGGDDKRQAEAERRARLLEPRLANLVIQVQAGRRVVGLVVRRDDEPVEDAMWNTALPIDPGSYAITAEAPGYRPWRTTVTIAPGATRQVVELPALVRVGPATAPPAPADATVAPWPPPRPRIAMRPVRERGTWSAMRGVSAVVGLAGAGALGTGIYFGIHARTLEDRADSRCPTAQCSDPEALRLNDQAKTSASRANILYIAGGAALATATLLWFVGAPDEIVVAPVAAAGSDRRLGLAMTGRF